MFSLTSMFISLASSLSKSNKKLNIKKPWETMYIYSMMYTYNEYTYVCKHISEGHQQDGQPTLTHKKESRSEFSEGMMEKFPPFLWAPLYSLNLVQ